MTENSLGTKEDDSWYEEAALKLRAALKENGELVNLRKAVRKPGWIMESHFFFGMWVRNFLRQNGFSEEDVKVGNLDDHYIPIMLWAVGYKIKGGYNNWDLTDLEKRLESIHNTV